MIDPDTLQIHSNILSLNQISPFERAPENVAFARPPLTVLLLVLCNLWPLQMAIDNLLTFVHFSCANEAFLNPRQQLHLINSYIGLTHLSIIKNSVA